MSEPSMKPNMYFDSASWKTSPTDCTAELAGGCAWAPKIAVAENSAPRKNLRADKLIRIRLCLIRRVQGPVTSSFRARQAQQIQYEKLSQRCQCIAQTLELF